jgi:hypothetical protein
MWPQQAPRRARTKPTRKYFARRQERFFECVRTEFAAASAKYSTTAHTRGAVTCTYSSTRGHAHSSTHARTPLQTSADWTAVTSYFLRSAWVAPAVWWLCEDETKAKHASLLVYQKWSDAEFWQDGRTRLEKAHQSYRN